MERRIFFAYGAALWLSVGSLTGCAGTGILSDVLGGFPGSGVSGEVRSVDERRREIEVRTAYGRDQTVQFDRNTRVVHDQRRYSVSGLEPGDEVSMQVQRDQRGGLYTDLIRVERSVRERRDDRYPDPDRDRRDADRGGQSFQGRVERIDHRAGWFELREDGRGTYMVTLPYRPGPGVADRFRRLRSGDYVRLSGELLNRERIELHRFR